MIRNAGRAVLNAVREAWYRWLWGDVSRLARAVHAIAATGVGADECWQRGALPMPVHYYSPVPDLGDLHARRVWDRRSALAGIDMRTDRQLELLAAMGGEFGKECRWLHAPTGDPYEFFTENTSFSYGCAASTYCMLRKHRPRRVIEIGSGASSRVIAAALRRNAEDDHCAADYTIIDPYPHSVLEALPGLTRMRRQRVELMSVDDFTTLEADDILFVDSGHTIRIGGDVNFLILDVLPVLATGVVVHFHDIPLPYEYAEAYYTNARFRMFWTEAYLLQAFLCHNRAYEVVLALNLLMRDYPAAVQAAWPHYDPGVHQGISHSFWIRRIC